MTARQVAPELAVEARAFIGRNSGIPAKLGEVPESALLLPRCDSGDDKYSLTSHYQCLRADIQIDVTNYCFHSRQERDS